MNKKDDQNPNSNLKDPKTTPEIIPKLDEKDLVNLISDEVIIFIIQKLREGPIEIDGLNKILKVKFRSMNKSTQDYLQLLLKSNFVREYTFKKTHPPPDQTPNLFPKLAVGEERKYLILVNDFYAIRKPPVEILDSLAQTDIPSKEVRELRKDIEQFFKKYTGYRDAGDDPDIIGIFLDPKLFAIMSFLNKKVSKISEIKAEFEKNLGNGLSKALQYLESKDFIKIILHLESNEKWVILKTAIELKAVFPEYLIRSINQQMAEKQMDKDFAIITLNNLKRFYLELENPEMLKKYLVKVNTLEKSIAEYIQSNQNGKKLDVKGITKNYKEIIEIYKQIGDLVNLNKYQTLLSEFEAKNK